MARIVKLELSVWKKGIFIALAVVATAGVGALLARISVGRWQSQWNRYERCVILDDMRTKCPIVKSTAMVDAVPCHVEEIEDPTRQDKVSTEEDSLAEAEAHEAEEEKLVDAFDNLTDKWMEPSAKGVKMGDIDNFTKSFRRVPKARKDECIHRALNLIPDENVMLLAGVLMDKTMDKEIVETVYNDILNRDEDVKKPILQEIFKDKSHPCWADTAWILDVTGELPRAAPAQHE